MNQEYPRPFIYSVLDHLQVTNTATHTEAEIEFLKNITTRDPLTLSPREIFVEYAADIEIMARADILIGCASNVYFLAALLRISRYYPTKPLNHTCYLELRHENQPLVCESDSEAKSAWSAAFGNNFRGGTSFWM
jgi:hypothetical protein